MNRTYFNKSLFTNTFSRLKTIGIVFTLICIIISIITPINRYIQVNSGQESYYEGYITTIVEVTPVLLAFMFIGVMVLIFSAFSHLNKRKSSDFFHSLSNTKICTYISMGAAALSWAYITIISTVLITSLTYSMLGIAVNSLFPIYLILTYLSCATLVASACLIAVSVTGTAFSNLIVTGLILMLPRFITFIFKIAVTSIAFNSTGSELGVISNYKYNLPFALVFSGMGLDNNNGYGWTDINELFISKGAILYTFIFALVYIALGCFLFTKRKSEIAEKSAPNKLLQHIYRMSIALPILLLSIIMYAQSIQRSITSFSREYSSQIMLVVALSLIVYFVYELITTKKVKNLVKAIPLYFALLLFVFGLGAAARGIGESVLNTTPSPSEVEAISIEANRRYDQNGYVAVKTDDIKFEDKQMIDILCTALKKDVDNYKSGSSRFVDSRYNYGGYTLHLKNGKKVSKLINLGEDEFFEIQDLKVNNIEYKKAFRELPKKSEIINITIPNLSKKESKEVWNSFVQEVETLSDKDVSRLTDVLEMEKSNNGLRDGRYKSKMIDTFRVEGNIGIKSFQTLYFLTNITPKTTNLYMSLLADKSIQDLKTETDRLINISSQSEDTYDYSIRFYGGIENANKYSDIEIYGRKYGESDVDTSNMTPSQTKQIFEIIKNSGFKNADINSTFINVHVSLSKGQRWGYFFIALSEEEMDKIIEIYESRKTDKLVVGLQ